LQFGRVRLTLLTDRYSSSPIQTCRNGVCNGPAKIRSIIVVPLNDANVPMP
jgi:hypothetical protein